MVSKKKKNKIGLFLITELKKYESLSALDSLWVSKLHKFRLSRANYDPWNSPIMIEIETQLKSVNFCLSMEHSAHWKVCFV